jgi:hypothetical protein
MRVFARRERPHPAAQPTLFEAGTAGGTRSGYPRPASSRSWLGQPAFIDADHRVHAQVEDAVRTGKDCGIGKYPSTGLTMNNAWQARRADRRDPLA